MSLNYYSHLAIRLINQTIREPFGESIRVPIAVVPGSLFVIALT